jgi:cyclopropane-fatty-acyl-phospholipid synthase
MSAPSPTVEAIRHHYEVSNEFYELLLGPAMQYSGGCWLEGEDDRKDQEVAQARKLDVFAELMHADGADRVLDIGCGWGSAMQRFVDHHDVKKAVGVTLSRTQKDYIDAIGNPRIEVRVESWEDHTTDEPYDAMFCSNALEHFVSSKLSPSDRVRRYRKFFRHTHSMLKPGGHFALHIMTIGSPPLEKQILSDLKFLIREEFEGCHLPYLYELTNATHGLFEVTEMHQDRTWFARACRVWLEHLADRRDEAVAMESEEIVARFERYLDVFAYMFEQSYFNNYRLALTRIDPQR